MPTPAASRCVGCSGRGGIRVAHAVTLDSPTLLTRAQTRLCLMRIAVSGGKTIMVRLQGRHVDECLPRRPAPPPAGARARLHIAAMALHGSLHAGRA